MRSAPSVVVVGAGSMTDDLSPSGARLERLRTQLLAFAGDIVVAEDGSGAGWHRVAEVIDGSSGAVGIVDATFVGHCSPLGDTIDDVRLDSAVLVDADGVSGVLRIASRDRATALAATRALAAERAPVRTSLLADRIRAEGVELRSVDPGPYVAGFARSPAHARQLLERAAGNDEHRLRLAGSVRPNDGFYSTFVVRRISRPLTALAIRLRVRPNSITVLSLFLGLIAAALFAIGASWASVFGAVLLQVSLVIDCVDGEVARYTRQFSAFGAWLDAVADRIKEFAVYAGLALAAARSGQQLWLLAGMAMAVLVIRHHVDFGFAIRQETRGQTTVAGQGTRREPSLGDRAADLSDRTNRRPALRWAKRVIIMPIGERWLAISVVAPIWGPRAVFVVLIATGVLAGLYTTTGRVLRSMSEGTGTSVVGRRDLALLTEVPILVPSSPPPDFLGLRLGWLLPAASRCWEFLAILLIFAVVGNAAEIAAFGLLAIIALHLYDLVYRLRHTRRPPPAWASLAIIGSVLRPAAVAVAAAAGSAVVIAVCLAISAVVIGVSVADWRSVVVGRSHPIGLLHSAGQATR